MVANLPNRIHRFRSSIAFVDCNTYLPNTKLPRSESLSLSHIINTMHTGNTSFISPSD